MWDFAQLLPLCVVDYCTYKSVVCRIEKYFIFLLVVWIFFIIFANITRSYLSALAMLFPKKRTKSLPELLISSLALKSFSMDGVIELFILSDFIRVSEIAVKVTSLQKAWFWIMKNRKMNNNLKIFIKAFPIGLLYIRF